MNKKFEYKTILIHGPQRGVFAEFPFESAKEFGTRKAIPVKATFDGKMYRMNLLPHGDTSLSQKGLNNNNHGFYPW